MNELQAALEALTLRRAQCQALLSPDEDRAYLSMIGKIQIMLGFIAMPPALAAKLPASGPGSMVEAIAMSEAMARDVLAFCRPGMH
jgi:hypothetical protein